MIWINALFALILALAISALLTLGLRWRHPSGDHPRTAMVFAGGLLFLVILLVSVWLPPHGPLLYGAPLLTMFVTGVVVALLFAAAAPPSRQRRAADAVDRVENAAITAPVFSVFFWILVFTLAVGFVVRVL